jgi:hypothetical protein
MKQFWIIPLTCMVMLCIGCAGSKKMRMPLAEIDRPIVDPKGTWSIKPTLSRIVAAQLETAYRGTVVGNWLFPGYSLTDNLSLPFVPFPYLIWQLTKSPLVDTTARYNWQFALSGGMTMYSQIWGVSGEIQVGWKKRLSSSVWYTGRIRGFSGNDGWMGMNIGVGPFVNGFGFQLSPKADVVASLILHFPKDLNTPPGNNFTGTGSFVFHYTFSPWFSINVGSATSQNSNHGYQIEMSAGGEFYW